MAHTAESRARAYAKMRARRAKWLSENGPCVSCSSNENLEVDHINPEGKVSHNVWSWKQERMEEELKKCQVLCTECHKAKTNEWKRSKVKHGSETMYGEYRCRCEPCVENRKVVRNANRKRRKEAGLPYQ